MAFHSPVRRIAAALPALLVLAACAGEESRSGLAPLSPANIGTEPTAERQSIVLCKVGTNASFDVVFDNGAPTAASLTDGECQTVVSYGGGFRKWTSVSENVPANTTLDSIVVSTVYGPTAPGSTLTFERNVLTGTTTAGAWVGLEFGAVITYYNTFNPPPPPPPPGGGEGCTPGYWKQPHHFDSWVGYSPNQTFASAFGSNVFNNMTLVQVLAQGGGGVKALGRHAVAALLNTTSSGVSYDLTTQEVIDAFNAAVASGNYTPLHSKLERLNEQGCPLN